MTLGRPGVCQTSNTANLGPQGKPQRGHFLMKLSLITSTSIVALAAAALIAGGAPAAPNSPDAEKQCVDEGGRVKDGTCVLPEGPPQPAEATTVKSSKSNSQDRTGGT